jgi:hypothetical protein
LRAALKTYRKSSPGSVAAGSGWRGPMLGDKIMAVPGDKIMAVGEA